jgi:hypothetical protein
VTIVTSIIAALGAFAVTALMIKGVREKGEGEAGAQPRVTATQVERETPPTPSATSPVSPATASTAPDAGVIHKPVVKVKPIPATTSAKPTMTTAPKTTGVATGLQLETKGP